MPRHVRVAFGVEYTHCPSGENSEPSWGAVESVSAVVTPVAEVEGVDVVDGAVGAGGPADVQQHPPVRGDAVQVACHQAVVVAG